jgi:hypothetical protein
VSDGELEALHCSLVIQRFVFGHQFGLTLQLPNNRCTRMAFTMAGSRRVSLAISATDAKRRLIWMASSFRETVCFASIIDFNLRVWLRRNAARLKRLLETHSRSLPQLCSP